MHARLLAALVFVLAVALAHPSYAQDGRWWRVETQNFIVYGDVNERQARDAAQSLEDFDLVLRALTRLETRTVETKLEVFLVRGIQGLRQVSPNLGDNVAGFYVSGGDLIAAFSRYDRDIRDLRKAILFHEYAHHFMLHYFPNAYPRWYIEGWAEYLSTVEIQNRRATIGRPSTMQSNWLIHSDDFPILDLLAPERLDRHGNDFVARFYANAWFAANYISNNTERLRGLERYVAMLGEGGDPIDSFEPAFGITPEQFNAELNAFRDGRARLLHVQLPEEPANMTVTRLPRTADDLLLPLAQLRVRSGQVSEADAAAMTRAAEPHLHEPMARLVMARLAVRQNNFAAARSHIEALFATDENHAEARYLLASIILEESETLPDAQARAGLAEARRHLVRSFRRDPNYFPTLYLYASTYAREPGPMQEEHLNILSRALELAPQSYGIRLLYAGELIGAEHYEEAQAILRPILYAPHGGEQSDYARWLFQAARLRQQPIGDWRGSSDAASADEP
ncbi:MAG: hypothetical protein K2P58_05680 [Hyphomonadaceae bacterium]|nr:hypothetical protein [Hyphomonadaceae bacterium]